MARFPLGANTHCIKSSPNEAVPVCTLLLESMLFSFENLHECLFRSVITIKQTHYCNWKTVKIDTQLAVFTRDDNRAYLCISTSLMIETLIFYC